VWAFVIPLMFHPWYAVLFYYAVGAALLGVTLSVVFQLPHCSGRAAFPLPLEGTERMADPWAVHQARVTLDFGRGNRILSWPLGGLNYHLEHHLFPTVCHVHYTAITQIVEQTCRDHGVPYAEHPSFPVGPGRALPVAAADGAAGCRGMTKRLPPSNRSCADIETRNSTPQGLHNQPNQPTAKRLQIRAQGCLDRVCEAVFACAVEATLGWCTPQPIP
jgi:hypothetical protein